MKNTANGKIQIGLIGAGTRIRGLIKHLIRRHPDAAVQFVAASDPDENAVAELENITGAKIRRHANHNELCAQKDIDWVFISSWNCFHREHAVAALAAGKNIFLEKPLATTLEDCLAIRAAQKKIRRTAVLWFLPALRAALPAGEANRHVRRFGRHPLL